MQQPHKERSAGTARGSFFTYVRALLQYLASMCYKDTASVCEQQHT
jgi:hypothetical protein